MRKTKAKSAKPASLRERAETILKESANGLSDVSHEDVRTLIQELHAYQSELEAQNEELRKAHADTAASEHRYSHLFEFAPVGYVVLDKEGLISEANLTAAKLLGTEKRHLVGSRFARFIPSDALDTFHAHCALALQSADQRTCVLKIHRKDGSVFDAQLASVAVSDGAGAEGRLRVSITDISDYTGAVVALRESEEKYRTIFDTAVDAVFLQTLDGRVLECSTTASAMFGYTREEITTLRSVDLVPAEVVATLPDAVHKPSSSGILIVEAAGRTKDGKVFPTEVLSRVIRLAGSAFVFSCVRDISDRKETERKLRQYGQDLERLVDERAARIRELERQRSESEKVVATGRMAARIAHEINNPLGGIKNALLLIKDAVPPDHKYYDYMELVEEEIDRIARIVHQMFGLYRPGQKQRDEFRVDMVIDDILTLLSPPTSAREIKIDVDYAAVSQTASMPEDLFRQIVHNLLQNAIEASPKGGVIVVRAATDEGELALTVSDQGPGIPEETRSQIYYPFFTTKDSLTNGGLGLGLAICKTSVTALGGTIDFETADGEGTMFRVKLPLIAGGKETHDG